MTDTASNRIVPEPGRGVSSRSAVRAILDAVAAGDTARLGALVGQMHAADAADLLEQMRPSDRRDLLRVWPDGIDGHILSEIDEAIRKEVVAHLPREVLVEAVQVLQTDDVVDILEDLDEPRRATVLDALAPEDRVAVEAAMRYPKGTAGRLMQREAVTAPVHWTVGAAIDHMRSGVPTLPEQFYHVILVDAGSRPQGYVTLGRLMASNRDEALRDITESSFRPMQATLPEKDVAYAFNHYHLISCPVVDADGRLVGVITIDDAVHALDTELEAIMLRLANVGDESSVTDNALETARRRLPWLVVNLFTASLSAIVISQFEDTIEAVVLLAALMPIVASTGGIAGTQSLAVAVRGLATRVLTPANAGQVVWRELGAGLLNGLALAAILFLAGLLLFGDFYLGVVLAAAMITNQIVAALGGVLVPLTLNRFGFDPALASGTFVTTMTDVMGFFAFLGFATILLL